MQYGVKLKSFQMKKLHPLLASQYPDFYDNNFAIMLRNFRNEAVKGANNKISYSTYKNATRLFSQEETQR